MVKEITMDKRKARFLLSYTAYCMGLIVVISAGIIYPLFNPHLTQSEVFLTNWYWYLLGIALVISGFKLYPPYNNPN